MKHIWLGAVISAVLLSGCSPYGSRTAPVTNLNPDAGLGRFSNMATSSNKTVSDSTTVRSLARVPTTPQRPVRPRTVETETNATSPYGSTATAQPYKPTPEKQNDGWNVTPHTNPTTPTNPTKNNIAQKAAEKANKTIGDNPIRPKVRQPESEPEQSKTANRDQVASASKSDSKKTDNNTQPEKAKDNNNKQVASIVKTPEKPTRQAAGGNAVSKLLQQASAALGKGDLDSAVAYLENAQRIEPQNAKILYDIGNIRYHQGHYKDAETFAGRAVQVGGSASMMQKSWALVANARKSLGDNQGAIAAAEKAASFQ